MKPRATLVTHVLRVESMNESKRLDQALTKFWDFESMCVVEKESVVQTQFRDYVSSEGGRYVVSLPWKDSSMLLPDNYDLCYKCFLSLIPRLKRTPDLEKYDEVIREQLRFCMHLIAIMADIEKAFRMVGVSKADQDVLRFLWSKDVHSPVQIYKFTRVVFGVGRSQYLLNATIAHHLELFKEAYPSTVSKLQESMYVDDKVLGVSWDISSDEMLFDLSSIWEEVTAINPTKRNVVSLISKIYDPLGLMAPVVNRLQIFFQELSKCKVEWDEELSLPLKTKWNGLVDGLKGDAMCISRYCFASVTNARLRLVGFCDASTKAYAAVVYLVNERSKSVIIAAKTRVSPLQTQTVPQLELLGALILAKLITSVRER
uniref:Reverse transcriptase domain-containing protein n=1 Tax=Amphimedon queenslandica TaxID=400682 RepID=A0A1X7VT18_AMPQE